MEGGNLGVGEGQHRSLSPNPALKKRSGCGREAGIKEMAAAPEKKEHQEGGTGGPRRRINLSLLMSGKYTTHYTCVCTDTDIHTR